MPVPQIDFSPLGDLYNTYQQGQQQATRQNVLSQLGQGGGPLDYGNAARQLLAAGDTMGGMSLAHLAQQQYLTSPEYIEKVARTKAQVEQEFGPKTIDVKTPGPFGDTITQTVEKGPNGYRALNVQSPTGGAENSGLLPNGMFAKGVTKEDQYLTGEQYLAQFSPDVQASVKNYLAGQTMPTSNPRLKALADAAKRIAQKYGPEVGIAADDAAFAARRKMQTDLSSSAPNTAGGILSNGKSAFEHLANLSDKMTDLGNYSLNFPGGGLLAQGANYIGNVPAATSETKGKVSAFAQNALKYGQEATKFYAGSGGGEAERMAALRALSPATSSGEEQAAYLQTEKELMLGRLRSKEAQVRDALGQSYLDNHPIMTPALSESLNKIDANMAKLRGQPAPEPFDYAPQASRQVQGGQSQLKSWENPQAIAAAKADPQGTLAAARASIQAGKDPRAVAQVLQQIGIDPSPLFGGQPGFANPGQRQ